MENIGKAGDVLCKLFDLSAFIGGATICLLLKRRIHLNEQCKENIIDDEYPIDSIKHSYFGECHCKRVKFQVLFPKILCAVDISSKIRFPRITIPCNDFRILTPENVLSIYPVQNNDDIGIYTFCSFCGVHILYSPSENPSEISININTLSGHNVNQTKITYCIATESVPIDISDGRIRQYLRRGIGYMQLRGPLTEFPELLGDNDSTGTAGVTEFTSQESDNDDPYTASHTLRSAIHLSSSALFHLDSPSTPERSRRSSLTSLTATGEFNETPLAMHRRLRVHLERHMTSGTVRDKDMARDKDTDTAGGDSHSDMSVKGQSKLLSLAR